MPIYNGRRPCPCWLPCTARQLYGFFVLWLSNNYAWRCLTGNALLPFFLRHAGSATHLDVGVGTGYYPSHSRWLRDSVDVTLIDLNPNTLQKAAQRCVQEVVHDVFTPLPDHLKGKFDAVSMFYLLHCLPGKILRKPDGTLYGATILGKGVQHNFFGRTLMRLYNKKGIFGNIEDAEPDLRAALEKHFEDVEVRTVGVVAMFVGKTPRRA
ncbi:S-adenosyl-L-methionine dependent methyltransferase [Trametopsis cervina]|nr:S-adenosyl-L-methionine dependent methyltransferase [Trametopsis cervina]